MKRFALTGALAALSFSTAAFASGPAVDVNVEGLQAKVAADVLRHAQQGERPLARYLERVRPYQRLSYDELSRPRAEPQAALAAKREVRRHAKDWAPQRYASAI